MGAENTIETYMKKKSENLGFLFYKFKSPSNNGVPDRILIGNGHVVFIELKAPGEKPRPLQKHVIAKMQKRGALVCVIDSKPDVDKLLKTIIEKKYIVNDPLKDVISWIPPKPS